MTVERGQMILFVLGTTIFILLLIIFIVLILFLYQRRHISHMKGIEAMRVEFEKTLLLARLEMKEQTLQNISREIHDGIGLSLTYMKLQLDLMPWPKSLLAEKEGMIDQHSKIIDDIRSLGRSMNTDLIKEYGLLHTLDLEMERIKTLNVYDVEYEITGTEISMDNEKELVTYRIIQELLNNTIKHSMATAIQLLLHYDNNSVNIKLADNGKGFEAGQYLKKNNGGTGLINVVNRVKLFNGSCKIDSQLVHGTCITIKIPFQHE